MSKRSTAFRLSVYISTAIITVLLVVTFVVYKDSHGLIRENIEKSAVSTSSGIITEIHDKVISSEELAKNTSGQLAYFLRNGDLSIPLSSLISNYPFVQSIHIDLDKGSMYGNIRHFSVYRENDSIKFSENTKLEEGSETASWEVKEITKTGRPGWSEPFKCHIDSEVVAMYCYPFSVKGNGENSFRAGYISVELSLSFLAREVKNIKAGKSGFIFLVSKEGTYLAHPKEELILTQNIRSLSESLFNSDRQKLMDVLENDDAGSIVAYPGLLHHKKSWIYYTPIPETHWMLIFAIPYNELFLDLWDLLYKIALVSIAGIILIFFLVSYISKKLMDPLAQIAGEIHEFTTAGRAKVSKNEVETLEKSYNLIQAWYNKFKKEQESSRQSSKQIKRELEQASEIINNIIPSQKPEFPGIGKLEIYSAIKPANVIGGDFYDYFLLDSNHLLITIGDVSGKGISAAMFMGVAHTLLRSAASEPGAKNIVKKVNKELFSKNQQQYFLTLFVGVLELDSGALNYCNAAHTASLIIKDTGEVNALSNVHGLPLGLYNNHGYKDSVVRLDANDVLFLYTDGVTETIDAEGQRYSEKKLKKELNRMKGHSPAMVVDVVEKSLRTFRGEEKQIDDYSIVVLKYLPE